MTDLTVIMCIEFDHRSPTDGLRKFRECIYKCTFVEVALEVSGTFDLIVQARLPSVVDYTDQMERIADKLQLYVKRYEANFVGRKVDRRHSTGEALWLPVAGGRKRVSTNLIDKIEANGDYMDVHVGSWHCMVHDTIHHMRDQLDREQFLQLHRSFVVRVDFIERLIHQNRRWTAKLRDGSLQRVAKSHVPEILRLLRRDTANGDAISAKVDSGIEGANRADEKNTRVGY